MRQKKWPVAAAVFLAAAVFFGLWQRECRDRSELELLCRSAAHSALESFQTYRDVGDESDYWYGVADFRSFEQAFYLLTEDTVRQADYVFCNEVYSHMVLYPERARAHMDEVIEVFSLWAEDVYDPNGCLRMAELRNTLSE